VNNDSIDDSRSSRSERKLLTGHGEDATVTARITGSGDGKETGTMAREISLSKRLEVVTLYFEGLAYDDIVKRTGVAKGSVSAIVEELKSGRFPQFEHVADLVNELRDLAVGLRKGGIAPAEAAPLFIVLKKLIGLGLEPARLEAWVRMCQSVPEEGAPRSHIIQAAVKLVELEQEGVGYEEAIERLRNSLTELKTVEEKLARLRPEEAQLEARKGDLLQENRSLEAERTRLQGRLNAMALKEKEVEEHCEDLSEAVKQRQEAVNRLEAKEGELTKEVGQLEEKALALEKEVTDKAQTLRGLEEVGFPRDDLEKLRARLSDIVERHGKEGLTVSFFGYLESYDSLLRLGSAKEKLAQEVESLTKQRDSLNRLAQRVGLTSDEVTEGIVAVEALRRRGVLPGAVVSYQKVLSEANTDPQSFQKVVEEFGGVETALAAKRGELDTVEQELEENGRALEELQGELAEVRQSIISLRDSGVKQINSMRSSAVADVKQLCRGLHDDIKRWGDMRAEMGELEEELKLARYFVKLPLSEEALSELVEDLATPIIIQYLTIALSWCREKLNPKLRPPREITKKYYSIGEYTEVELADVLIWALLMLIGGVGSDKE